MSNLNEILTFEYQNEHVLEHVLPMKKNFSNPKIYNANGDLSKRWYVYFSFRNPKSGKLERMKNIYGKTNFYKTKEERLSVLTIYRRKLLQILKDGFNPFDDNVDLFSARAKKVEIQNIQPETPIVNNDPVLIDEQPKLLLKDAFDYGLKIKEKLVNSRTYSGYDNRMKNFLKWIEENHPEIKFINELKKKDIAQFLNEVLYRTSARTRNNFRLDLGSILQTLEDNDIIEVNLIKKIPVLKSIPERNKTYTTEKQEEIFNYLEESDPLLLLYIKFISYNFSINTFSFFTCLFIITFTTIHFWF